MKCNPIFDFKEGELEGIDLESFFDRNDKIESHFDFDDMDEEYFDSSDTEDKEEEKDLGYDDDDDFY